MKRTQILAISIFFTVLALSVFAGEKIILATGEWRPYTSQGMENYGLFTEIVTAVFRELGMEAEYRFYPWKRCEAELVSGKVAAIFPYYKTDERMKIYHYTDSVAVSKNGFFYLKKRLQGKDIVYGKLEDLKPYKIGGNIGYWYIPDFEKAGLDTEYVPDEESNVRKLYAGRIDLFVQDLYVGWELIKKIYPENVGDFGILDKALSEGGLYLMFAKNNPQAGAMIQKFNEGLEMIKKKGIYKKILEKYDTEK